jgi:hypothetical protein
MKNLFFRIAMSAMSMTAVSGVFSPASVQAAQTEVFNKAQQNLLSNIICTLSAFEAATVVSVQRSEPYQKEASKIWGKQPMKEHFVTYTMMYSIERDILKFISQNDTVTQQQIAFYVRGAVAFRIQETIDHHFGKNPAAANRLRSLQEKLQKIYTSPCIIQGAAGLPPKAKVLIGYDIVPQLHALCDESIDTPRAITSLNSIIEQLKKPGHAGLFANEIRDLTTLRTSLEGTSGSAQ